MQCSSRGAKLFFLLFTVLVYAGAAQNIGSFAGQNGQNADQNVDSFAISSFVGTYEPNQGCVPSQTCCCAVSPVSVTSADGVSLDVTGSSDGGAGCFNQK